MSQIDWKAVAIKELRTYKEVCLSLQSLPDLIERQKMIVGRIRTNNPAKVYKKIPADNDTQLSAIVYRDELEHRLKEAKKTVAAINMALSAMTEEEYLLLDTFFIHPRKNGADMLCEKLCIERSAVYERRNKALEKFTRSLYGCVTE
ncbi:MAG: hypothetical protein IKY18_04180 [Oscillospiraceae bacterium]|nr:hypothetical protein [Oscillospiraceae bacterium]